MPFERFTRVGARRGVKLSIRKNGQIGFSLAAMDTYNIPKYSYAVLFFDGERKLLGVRLTNEGNEEGAYKLQKRQGSSGFSAKAFLDHYHIDYSKTKKFKLFYDENEDMLIADISMVFK